MRNEFLREMINLLEVNQRFPKYQMERRVDILIYLFLPDIIRWKFGKDYKVDFIIPELPIKKEGNNLSTNLDYFVICNSKNKGFLVELKTDANSCRPEQMHQYFKVKNDRFKAIIDGIQDIIKVTKRPYRKKYKDLLDILENKVNSEIQLDIIYILPESGITKLQIKNPESNQNIHFITLESLKAMEYADHLQEEWDLIRQSKLFQPEN
jgi:hypothetical protein